MTSASLLLRLVIALTALAGGFALGSIPFSVWLGRRAAGLDVRDHGSRNPGAANVWRTVGRAAGILVGAADAAKGAAAVWLAWRLGLPDDAAVWAGAAAVAGHDFSPWLGFKGGKGGATTCGVLACFAFPEMLMVLCFWLIAGKVDRARRFLWSIVALSACPIFMLVAGRAWFWPLASIPPRSPSVILASAALIVLLWTRVIPGLRSADV